MPAAGAPDHANDTVGLRCCQTFHHADRAAVLTCKLLAGYESPAEISVWRIDEGRCRKRSRRLRIEHVAQAVAQEVQSEHGHGDRAARKQRERGPRAEEV